MNLKDLSIPYRVESMMVSDLDAVMEIENLAHASPWPASAYRHELEQNTLSHYFVLVPEEFTVRDATGMRARLLAWLGRPRPGRPVIGYGGFWMMVDEAHISTIAIDPEWRGMGLGELVLLELLERAIDLGAETVTLEVRISNTTAQNLYEKYRFEYVGRRKRYYRDNNEDAHIMTVEDVQSPEYRSFLRERRSHLQERLARRQEE
ncbi:MAG: ribosomal protein S18-alanine N-acetyltransferase [Chloroflexota bacterium]|nr:ribosomal protein S18-alanine N-acetyltransferase [Chloroflexota bacterium]